ncbi:MAG: 1-deoxy-D-xylulose-5-phosphate synthase [Candidatus Omnitrophota bacterium]|nr:MAG: 1-deoxy-D-xylulose-5-phosphate synthase [Candidatus Omnitrophota bacterium]
MLEKIASPEDLRKIEPRELPQLAEEIRERIIRVVSSTGGHLASSLGAVELAIALHYCLGTPRDKIIWDVGHQAYAHKILTGRNKDFDTLRQYAGLSGFPTYTESEYDIFTTGHSSTAVSLALGLVCAQEQLKPNERFKVVAIIGDGSLSGGLCFEGLNNAGHSKKDILIILNTNEMSIAPNAGALSIYLNKIISLPIYNRFRSSLESFVKSRLPKGSRIIKLANKFEEGLKGLFIPGMLFEELGFRYFGPLDGHNLDLLIPTLRNLLTLKGPILLHVVTKKGKGYPPAEKEPVRFHSVSPFVIENGKPLLKDGISVKSYTEVFSKKLAELALFDKRIVAITAAMPEGTGLDRFRDLYPQRFYDVGIAEGHAVCFASGLACQGLKPVVAVYSTFLQRAYDQIIEEIALQKKGVIFALDRAGIVGEDGPTHQGVFDLAFLRSIPNFTLMAPKDGNELEAMLDFALGLNMPAVIRYPKSKISNIDYHIPHSPIKLGKAEVLKKGKNIIIIALGSMVAVSMQALDILEKSGLHPTLINARFAKPLDTGLFQSLSVKAKFIFTVEEGIREGGFGSAVAESLCRPVIRIGLPCEFIPHGKREILLDKFGLTASGIADKIKSIVIK